MHGNVYRGISFGAVIQLRDVLGDLHVSCSAPAAERPHPLVCELSKATVIVEGPTGVGRGVRVEPAVVLTSSSLVPEADRLAEAPQIAVLRMDSAPEPFVCVKQGVPVDERMRVVVERLPGAPVLNWITGGVCGLLAEDGAIVEIPPLQDLPRNDAWLDLLDRDQLEAGAWRHVPSRLREYLRAVVRVGNQHEYEYRSLGGRSVPDLKSIYLRRWVNPSKPDAERDIAEPSTRTDADKLLTDFPGVQVLAERGVGKSSLVRHYAATLARTWLADRSGEVVPIPITAGALSRGRTLPDALAAAVGRDMSVSLSEQQLAELFSDSPVPGVPWLVLVDGLDEVVDVSARSWVVQQVHDHREEGGRYRFVLTSRHIDQIELVRFDKRQYPTYLLELFSLADLARFVTVWLAAEGRDAAGDRATALIGRLDARFREMARVPLIATMLCAVYCADITLDPPRDQADLYQRFVRLQLSKIRRVDLRRQLHNWQRGHGYAADAIDRLLEQLEPLLEDLAQAVLTDDKQSALDFAVGWDTGSQDVDQWPTVVAEVLRTSGLLVARGSDFQFRHRTIAEFLAARHLARVHPDPVRLLAPRRRETQNGEWTDRDQMVFLAALLIRGGKNITSTLRVLLRPWNRKQNVGFLAALVRHGVKIDETLRIKALMVLERIVCSSASRDQWQRSARWMLDFDQMRAVIALKALVDAPDVPQDRKFEALQLLIEHDVDDSMETAVRFLANPQTRSNARTSLDRILAQVDPARSIKVFSQLATHAPNARLRLTAAKFVANRDRARGLRLVKSLADHPTCDSDTKGQADDLADELERRLAEERPPEEPHTDPWMTGIAADLESCDDQSLWKLMDLRHTRVDPGATVEALIKLVDDRTKPVARRTQIARFLLERAAGDPRIPPLIVRTHDLPPALRITAALRHSDCHRHEAFELLAEVASSPSVPGAHRVRAAVEANALNPVDGYRVLTDLAADEMLDGAAQLALGEELGEQDAWRLLNRLQHDPRVEEHIRRDAAIILLRRGLRGDPD